MIRKQSFPVEVGSLRKMAMAIVANTFRNENESKQIDLMSEEALDEFLLSSTNDRLSIFVEKEEITELSSLSKKSLATYVLTKKGIDYTFGFYPLKNHKSEDDSLIVEKKADVHYLDSSKNEKLISLDDASKADETEDLPLEDNTISPNNRSDSKTEKEAPEETEDVPKDSLEDPQDEFKDLYKEAESSIEQLYVEPKFFGEISNVKFLLMEARTVEDLENLISRIGRLQNKIILNKLKEQKGILKQKSKEDDNPAPMKKGSLSLKKKDPDSSSLSQSEPDQDLYSFKAPVIPTGKVTDIADALGLDISSLLADSQSRKSGVSTSSDGSKSDDNHKGSSSAGVRFNQNREKDKAKGKGRRSSSNKNRPIIRTTIKV